MQYLNANYDVFQILMVAVFRVHNFSSTVVAFDELAGAVIEHFNANTLIMGWVAIVLSHLIQFI